MQVKKLGIFSLALGTLVVGAAAHAADLRVGLAAEPSALDPHYHNLTPNNSMRQHIFESLIAQDENQRLQPELATSWKHIDDTTWEIKLREGVTFHDGSAFDAQDVVFSLCRVPEVPNSPSSFAIYTKAVQGVETPDDHTLIVKTAEPYPLLANDLSTVAILSAETGGVTGDITFAPDGCSGIESYPATEDFNDGTAAIGTGPYTFQEYVKGDRIVVSAYPDYWGPEPTWETVTFKPIPSDGPRVAALLAGDVDLIESPPSQDLERLRNDPSVKVVDGLSNRVIYVAMDQHMEPSPGIEGAEGKNPLKDARVRKAMSLAINRDAIADRIMGGQSVPAGQLVAPGLFGYDDNVTADSYDPERAKELLAEAGYPDGFKLVLATPNDRYMNDSRIAQAIAQFWNRVGIETSVDAQTKSVFFSRRNNYEFSTYLAGWASGTGEASSPLKALVACQKPDIGFGGTNRGRYCNEAMDEKLAKALRTVDEAKRETLLKEAGAIVAEDTGILPIHYEKTPWALRKGLDYVPRLDQYTLATAVQPVSN